MLARVCVCVPMRKVSARFYAKCECSVRAQLSIQTIYIANGTTQDALKTLRIERHGPIRVHTPHGRAMVWCNACGFIAALY